MIAGIHASSEVGVQESDDEKYPAALKQLYSAMQAGPSEIEPTAPTGELRGFGFGGFDGLLYKFFEKREFVPGQPYALLDYACGTGRWSANAVLQAEMDKVRLNIKAVDPFMQPEHAEYYNQVWSTYVRENRSSHGALSVGRAWLKDIVAEKQEKFNAVLVRDAIHLFSDEQIAELFQLSFALTEENGSIVLQATPPFATIFWNPSVQVFMNMRNLTPPNFGEIFFNMFSYKAYTDYVAQNVPGVVGQMNTKSVCLPVIRNAAVANGWWLQAIQVGTTVMTHTKPLTEKQLYEFVMNQIMRLKPKPEELTMDYKPKDPGIFLRFKKNPIAQTVEAK